MESEGNVCKYGARTHTIAAIGCYWPLICMHPHCIFLLYINILIDANFCTEFPFKSFENQKSNLAAFSLPFPLEQKVSFAMFSEYSRRVSVKQCRHRTSVAATTSFHRTKGENQSPKAYP